MKRSLFRLTVLVLTTTAGSPAHAQSATITESSPSKVARFANDTIKFLPETEISHDGQGGIHLELGEILVSP